MKKNKLIYLVVTLILITVSFFGISKVTDNIYKSEKLVFNENNTTELSEQSKYTVGNYYLVKDNWILGKFSKIIQDDKMQIYADAINTLSNNARTQNKDVYFISMTHKTNMLKHLYPDFVMNKENIDLNKQWIKIIFHLLILMDIFYLTLQKVKGKNFILRQTTIGMD